MRAKAVFAGDGIFEDEKFERVEGESHVATEKDEEANAGEIGSDVCHGAEPKDGIESELTKYDGSVESGDVYGQDGAFGEFFVRIKNCGNKKCENEKADKFSAEIIRIFAIEISIIETPEECRSDGDFDVLPGAFVDSREKAEDVVFATDVVKEMGKSTDGRDDNDAEPKVECVIHKDIIAYLRCSVAQTGDGCRLRGIMVEWKVEEWPSG